MSNNTAPAPAPVPVTVERDSIGALFLENRVLKAELTRAAEQLKKMAEHAKDQEATIARMKEGVLAPDVVENEGETD